MYMYFVHVAFCNFLMASAHKSWKCGSRCVKKMTRKKSISRDAYYGAKARAKSKPNFWVGKVFDVFYTSGDEKIINNKREKIHKRI